MPHTYIITYRNEESYFISCLSPAHMPSFAQASLSSFLTLLIFTLCVTFIYYKSNNTAWITKIYLIWLRKIVM